MPVTSVTKDPTALTLEVVADFNAPLRRVWDAYFDPRKLEQFWGPPTYPARFIRHDGAVGGRSQYAMTGPAGDVSRGYWEWLAIEPLSAFTVLNGFALADGSAAPGTPVTRMRFCFEPTARGTRVTTTTQFDSGEDLTKLMEMGMQEGMTLAMGQMDVVIADLQSFSAELATLTQRLNDTQVRISRVIHGPIEAVWRAHHEPQLLQQWLLGPDGWTMPVCEVATQVGGTHRYEWESGERRFGFEGELLASSPPYREVTTERMIGTQEPENINELTLTALESGTLLSLLITYPSAEVRDAILATGMTEGMETSYRRLETELLTPA